jgi:hypothetical protein
MELFLMSRFSFNLAFTFEPRTNFPKLSRELGGIGLSQRLLSSSFNVVLRRGCLELACPFLSTFVRYSDACVRQVRMRTGRCNEQARHPPQRLCTSFCSSHPHVLLRNLSHATSVAKLPVTANPREGVKGSTRKREGWTKSAGIFETYI